MQVNDFKNIWFVDFEFHVDGGNLPEPICVVFIELRTGRVVKQILNIGDALPIAFSDDDLFVAYAALAELSCYHAMGWQMPKNVLDLHVEFRWLTNGIQDPKDTGLLAALDYHNLPHISAEEKKKQQSVAIRGAPYTNEELGELLEYCVSDVIELRDLFVVMEPKIDLPRALLRGSYEVSLSKVERNGIPLDMEKFNKIRDNWDAAKVAMIESVDKEYNVFENGKFVKSKFGNYLNQQNITWPLTPTGQLKLDEDTFSEKSKMYPQLHSLRELQNFTSKMRLRDLSVGRDGRNRCSLMPFSSRTGRNQPSNAKFIFGPAKWIRHLICPPEGSAVAYLDWSSQEFAIAAYLSQDTNMLEAYATGDPYLAFAKVAGAVPQDATKQSHETIRDKFKICCLSVQYGQTAYSLATRLGLSVSHAQELLDHHHRAFPKFWQWCDDIANTASLTGKLTTTFGWRHLTPKHSNPRSLVNFPVQGNGSEMLRIAIILAVERGVKVIAPVHDAILIELKVEDEQETLVKATAAMREASEYVLPGFPVRTEAKTFYSNYSDSRSMVFWNKLDKALSATNNK